MKPRQGTAVKKSVQRTSLDYKRFSVLNGDHSFKQAAPGAYVEYQARRLHGGRIAYFNFELAMEMGLIPTDHTQRMNSSLARTILDTFAIQIINEYDLNQPTPIRKDDILPGKYMATRYLQLQHPGRSGKTSGDGRSVWNGEVSHRGITWDVSSCGTGATRLSPGAVIENKFFKTGDPHASYGCGLADVHEGLSAAIMSGIFHRNGIPTERTLAVIEFRNGRSINVRAGKNLIRPSHLFAPLKQGNFDLLKAVADHFIDRQIHNGEWQGPTTGDRKYPALAEQTALTFARLVARFETDYIFVWLDWDGDNILANGGIIDYGSVRQFGLCHGRYRFDDGDRWSTSLPEQRLKARDLVQVYAQLCDFLATGTKKSLDFFAHHKAVKLFDEEFNRKIKANILYRMGLKSEHREYLLERHGAAVSEFVRAYHYFERATSRRKPYRVPDGITQDAIFSMRDLMRELPAFMNLQQRAPDPREFIAMAASTLTSRLDRALNRSRKRRVYRFLKQYEVLVSKIESHFRRTRKQALTEIQMRSSVINAANRITGESVILVTSELVKAKRNMTAHALQKTILELVQNQILRPQPKPEAPKQPQGVLKRILSVVAEYRDGL